MICQFKNQLAYSSYCVAARLATSIRAMGSLSRREQTQHQFSKRSLLFNLLYSQLFFYHRRKNSHQPNSLSPECHADRAPGRHPGNTQDFTLQPAQRQAYTYYRPCWGRTTLVALRVASSQRVLNVLFTNTIRGISASCTAGPT